MTDGAGEPTLEIHDLSVRGEGVGRLPDGRAAFVPGAVPGDAARIRIVREKSRWVRGELVSLVAASPDRREPRCPLFQRCGGCQLQHLAYRAQVEWKGRRVRDALERVGGVTLEGLPGIEPGHGVPVEAAPAEWRYRNRMSFTLKRLRSGRVVAGLHRADHPGRIQEVADECLLPEAPVLAAWTGLREAWGPGAVLLPPGGELRLTLRSADQGVVLLVEGGEAGGDAGALVEAVPGLLAVAHRPRAGGLRHLAGPETVRDQWFGTPVPVASGAFMQVNREMAEALHLSVLKELGNPRGLRVVDGYCGVGAYGRRLARHGARVVGLELDPQAVAAARDGAPEGLEIREGRVEALLEAALPADRVIVNPPRSGLHEAVPELLRARPPERVLYISCDPATLARDVARLGEGFTPRRVRAFDLFPQTTHVETVITLDAVNPCETA